MLPTTVSLSSVDYVLERQLMRTTDARGHYTVGKELADNVIDRIRRVAGRSTSIARHPIDSCINLQVNRQLLLAPGFPRIPLLRRRHRLRIRRTAAGAPCHRLRQEV